MAAAYAKNSFYCEHIKQVCVGEIISPNGYLEGTLEPFELIWISFEFHYPCLIEEAFLLRLGEARFVWFMTKTTFISHIFVFTKPYFACLAMLYYVSNTVKLWCSNSIISSFSLCFLGSSLENLIECLNQCKYNKQLLRMHWRSHLLNKRNISSSSEESIEIGKSVIKVFLNKYNFLKFCCYREKINAQKNRLSPTAHKKIRCLLGMTIAHTKHEVNADREIYSCSFIGLIIWTNIQATE